ncbi:MAG: DUF2975 domain-containing protein [Luteimonas sp.]
MTTIDKIYIVYQYFVEGRPMLRSPSNPLPIAEAVLRVLIILNWIYGAVVLAILLGLISSGQWTLAALGVPTMDQTSALLMGMRAIAALGLMAVPLNLAVLRRLVGMVRTVRDGDPFVALNADRMQVIAWCLLGQQVLSVLIGLVARWVSTPAHSLHLDAGFSPSGWLAVILTFVLARVFVEGTQMRHDLDGTV